jgi:hypothetical protein
MKFSTLKAAFEAKDVQAFVDRVRKVGCGHSSTVAARPVPVTKNGRIALHLRMKCIQHSTPSGNAETLVADLYVVLEICGPKGLGCVASVSKDALRMRRRLIDI